MRTFSTVTQPMSHQPDHSFGEKKEHLLQTFGSVLLFILPHIPLAIMMGEVSALATVHGLAVFLVGTTLAFSGRSLHRVAYVGAYIAGTEVLWRMTGARVPWEFGKYAVTFLFGLALLQSNRLRGPLLPTLYFLCLLPSVSMTVAEAGLLSSRELVSFNLSGPLSLVASAWFFSNLRFSPAQRRTLLVMMIAPIVGLSAIVLFGIATTPDIQFGSSSNKVLSGGYGPNQVSAVFGFGAVLAFWYLIDEQAPRPLRGLMLALAFVFITQSMLTFSRGGLYNLLGSILPALLFLLADPRLRTRLLTILAIAGVVVYFFVLPGLDEFTGGALENRFTSTRLSHRDQLAEEDIETWLDNPILGVGPGMGVEERSKRSILQLGYFQAHTEQTRLLSEHGIYGLIALLLLVVSGLIRIIQAPTIVNKAFIISLLCFCFVYMLHASMRLLIPGFVFGLTFLTFSQQQKEQTRQLQHPPGQF